MAWEGAEKELIAALEEAEGGHAPYLQGLQDHVWWPDAFEELVGLRDKVREAYGRMELPERL